MSNTNTTPEAEPVRISIVVACRNEGNSIRSLVQSILNQDLEDSWEAIFADGTSTDQTHEILSAYCARDDRLRLIDNPKLIVSAGLNAAIAMARGEVIIRMDGHTRYAPDYCRMCVTALETAGADNVGGPARTQTESILGRAVAAAFHSRFSTGGAKFHDVSYRGWVDTVPYGCWRKVTLLNLGLFDESLVRNQDDELNLRLIRSGGKIWQDPSIISWYSPRADLSKLFRQYFQYGFWKVAVIRKHRLPSSWRHLVPVLWLTSNFMLLGAMAISKMMHSQEWFATAGFMWIALAGLYLLATIVASISTAGRNNWMILAYLPAIFATFHCSYGLGFASGLVHFRNHRASLPPSSSAFSKLTR
ncbi:MAG TPA: glycosyltransferase family 2 protein [Candidatus Sulfotelmatobacter sp.]|nr:glycosyltransferase family 2 protein [Candidatus Sulfotelmatobacter sp.]